MRHEEVQGDTGRSDACASLTCAHCSCGDMRSPCVSQSTESGVRRAAVATSREASSASLHRESPPREGMHDSISMVRPLRLLSDIGPAACEHMNAGPALSG